MTASSNLFENVTRLHLPGEFLLLTFLESSDKLAFVPPSHAPIYPFIHPVSTFPSILPLSHHFIKHPLFVHPRTHPPASMPSLKFTHPATMHLPNPSSPPPLMNLLPPPPTLHAHTHASIRAPSRPEYCLLSMSGSWSAKYTPALPSRGIISEFLARSCILPDLESLVENKRPLTAYTSSFARYLSNMENTYTN